MATAITNITKAVLAAAIAAADKYGPVPAKAGEARLSSACRHAVIVACVAGMDERQKAVLAKMGLKEKHSLMANLLVQANTTIGVTLTEQIAALKGAGCMTTDARMPCWPKVHYLDKLLGIIPPAMPKEACGKIGEAVKATKKVAPTLPIKKLRAKPAAV